MKMLEDRELNYQDNTVGRQNSTTKHDWAYIAGFIDGDGSIMMQFKIRTDSKRLRVMFTVCLYQDTRHEQPLFWIKDRIGIGYISRRNDGMTELRVNGYAQVKNLMIKISPFLKFKKRQAEIVLKSLRILEEKGCTRGTLLEIAELSEALSKENYFSSRRKYTPTMIKEMLLKGYLSP